MTSYRITLTPLEPYFFGNEKNFNFGTTVGQKSQSNYYIKSDYTPETSIQTSGNTKIPPLAGRDLVNL